VDSTVLNKANVGQAEGCRCGSGAAPVLLAAGPTARRPAALDREPLGPAAAAAAAGIRHMLFLAVGAAALTALALAAQVTQCISGERQILQQQQQQWQQQEAAEVSSSWWEAVCATL